MATPAPHDPGPTPTAAEATRLQPKVSDLAELLQAASRIAHGIPGNSAERNLVKLAEETGELARTWTRQMAREAVIEEASDVVITALVAAAFVDASAEELAAMLDRKLAKSLSRCRVEGGTTGASAALPPADPGLA